VAVQPPLGVGGAVAVGAAGAVVVGALMTQDAVEGEGVVGPVADEGGVGLAVGTDDA
jgi:hypothetical protein